MKCQFWNHGGSRLVDGSFVFIREGWGLKYTACFILCPVSGPVPDSVSIVTSDSEVAPTNKLPVNNREPADRKEEIAVCVKPLHYNYDKVYEIVEFIEVYRILGVSEFVLYNHSVGFKAECLLKR